MAQAEVILNRLCDLQGTNFQIKDVHVTEQKIIWWIDHQENQEYECPKCHQKTNACHSRKWVKIKDVPLGRKDCIWMVNRAQILCSCSLNPIVEHMPFRSKYHRLTQRFVDYLEALLCLHQFTVADVARMFNLDYGIVYKIDHVVLLRLIQELKIPDPIHISVDEKSFQKGHKYVTIVTDTDSRKVIWVSEGNKKISLDQFFQILGPERCLKIKTVSKDLHKPYALSCKEHVPQALEVADPFHVVQRLGQALEECRKELMVESDISVKKKKRLGPFHWVLRFKQENMQAKHVDSLSKLEELNRPLYQAYLLKEAFFDLFDYKPSEVEKANDFLIHWIVEAHKINLKGFKKFAEYISRNTKILINIVKTGRSSAVSEGINRKINVVKAMAYGYRNIQYFMLKIMQRCGVLGAMWSPAAC